MMLILIMMMLTTNCDDGNGGGDHGVSMVWQVGHVLWAPLEGWRHSTGLFLTYDTRLTFLTV